MVASSTLLASKRSPCIYVPNAVRGPNSGDGQRSNRRRAAVADPVVCPHPLVASTRPLVAYILPSPILGWGLCRCGPTIALVAHRWGHHQRSLHRGSSPCRSIPTAPIVFPNMAAPRVPTTGELHLHSWHSSRRRTGTRPMVAHSIRPPWRTRSA